MKGVMRVQHSDQIFIIMRLPSDTIYQDLKERGLALSPPTQIAIPVSPPLQKGLISKLTSAFSRPAQGDTQSRIIAIPILNSAILVARQQMVYLYRYSIQEETRVLETKLIQTLSLTFEVLSASTCDPKFVQDRGDVPILLEAKNGFALLVFDVKEMALVEKNFIKQERIIGMNWISEKECIVMDNLNFYHYYLSHGLLKPRLIIPSELRVGEHEMIRGTWITGSAEEEQDARIVIFYTTTSKTVEQGEKHVSMRLKIKELVRTLDGELVREEKADYQVESVSLEYWGDFTISGVGDYYCLQMPRQIVVLKKKFDKYMFLDTMAEMMNGYKVKLGSKGMVSSIGSKLLELNVIQFADPKCASRICDIIEFPEDLVGREQDFKEIWPILDKKEYTLIFVFLSGATLTLYTLVKMEPMEKVLALANKSSNEPLEVIQDIAQNLGIPRKDFYVKLWSTSKKTNNDIYKFLIPCKDVGSIKKELKSLLRRRTISVSEMLKILEKVGGIIDESLKSDLNQSNLKEYVKNDFLLRKLKLNEMNKKMDHRIFDKIYSSSLLNLFDDIVSEELDPRQIIIDPLHAMVDQEPYRELKSLENVFQEFKVIILENYKEFLIEFLSKFPKKLPEVLSTFSFLLPNYPFQIEVQKPLKTNELIIKDPKASHNDQPLWFQEVTVVEWQTELTKERILKKLYNDYPTSKILETVDEFYNSMYGRENKRWKHGLIVRDLDEYAQKLSELKGIQLYLDICQFSNELAIDGGSDPIWPEIVNTLEIKNKLKEPAIHDCKLYASMHYFMLKHEIIPREKLEISSLTRLKPENLVALFFLENKQRKEHIFNEFKDLYTDKKEFKEVLERFVQSENCSRIELEILMKEIIAKGRTFQEENQDLIELLITGLCMKVEIRESLSILDNEGYEDNLPTLIESVALSKNLALKINLIKQLKRCQEIFRCFGLEKKTYEELLSMEENNQVFKLLLDKFFDGRETEEATEESECLSVVIEDEKVSLDSPRNMLTVLIYLQETVYYSTKTFELLILYGLELILWKEFEVIKDILSDESALEALDINRNDFMEELILRALDTIYLDEQIIFDDETKEQIINILNIDDEISPLKIRELAKLELVDIFESWELEVPPCDIHTICHQWKEHNRTLFMEDLIVKYIDKLDFKTFQNIYVQLEIADKETQDVHCLNEEYVSFCDVYAHKLLEEKRYPEVIEVIIYMMSIPEVQVGFSLLSEAFLKSLGQEFPEDRDLGRRMIEFFVQNYNSSEEYYIKQLLEKRFDEGVLVMWKREDSIIMEESFLYSEARGSCSYQLEDLWKMALEESSNTDELYYNYFFLVMGLSNPNVGFTHIFGISYNLEKVTNIFLVQLEDYISHRPDLWLTDYDSLLKLYMTGILREAIERLDEKLKRDAVKTSKVDLVLDLLRSNKSSSANEKFIATLSRVKAEKLNKSRKVARKERFNKKLKEILEKEEKKKKKDEEEMKEEEPVEEPSQPEIFLDWRKIEEEKRNITSQSQVFISEKDMIDQIYELLANNPAKRTEDRTKNPAIKHNLFSGLFLPRNSEDVNLLLNMLKRGEGERVAQYPAEAVAEAIKKAASEPEVDIYTIIDVMDSASIGDPKKRDIIRLTKYFKGDLPIDLIKALFPVESVMTFLDCPEEEKYEAMYREVQPRIKELIPGISSKNLKDLAHLLGNTLESSQYSAQVYFETLIWLGNSAPFDSHYAILAEECIRGLGDYPELVVSKHVEILENLTKDLEMKLFVREHICKLMEEKGYEKLAREIRAG